MVLNRRTLERSFSPHSKLKRRSSVLKKSFSRSHNSGGTSTEKAKCQSNVKVVVRVRPTNERELGDNYRSVIQIVDEKMLVFDPRIDEPSFFYHGVKQSCRDLLKKQNKDTTYMFDKVFGFSSTNQEIFEGSTKELIKTLLDGFNCSVFVYGATGAGKTYTMLGSPESPGITYLTMVELYNEMEQLKEEKIFDLCVSYLEVYNENVRDLLQPSGPLHVREDARAGISVAGLKMESIDSADKLLAMLAQGNKNRTQHPTDANSESSRSHAVFQVHIRMTHRLTGQISLVKLSMVDLAGSERGSATGCTGVRFTEGANINKSLLALGNCITSLADGLKHVPYRDSKLTRLLKDSLGGNCYTVMIANISPSSKSYEDTQNTLKYATRAMKIKTEVKNNVVNCEMHISQYAKLVEELNRKVDLQNQEITHLKEQLNLQGSCTSERTVKLDDDKMCRWRRNLKDLYRTKRKLHSEILLTEMKRKILKWREYTKEKAIERINILCYDHEQLEQAMTRIEASQKQFRGRAESLTCALKTFKKREMSHKYEIDSALKLIEEDGYSEHLKEEILINNLMVEKDDAEVKTQHLRKLISLQQNEMEGHYIMFNTICHMMREYHLMLKGFGKETSSMEENYQKAVRMIEGVKGITWEDSQTDKAMDLKELMRLSAALAESTSFDSTARDDKNFHGDSCEAYISAVVAKDSEEISRTIEILQLTGKLEDENLANLDNDIVAPLISAITVASSESLPECVNNLPVESIIEANSVASFTPDCTPERNRNLEETKELSVLKIDIEAISSEIAKYSPVNHKELASLEPDLNTTFSCDSDDKNCTVNYASDAEYLPLKAKEPNPLKPQPDVPERKKVQEVSNGSPLNTTFCFCENSNKITTSKIVLRKISPNTPGAKKNKLKCKDGLNKTFMQHKKILSPTISLKRNVLGNRNIAIVTQKDFGSTLDRKRQNNAVKMKSSFRVPNELNSNLNKENIYSPKYVKRKLKTSSDSIKLPAKKNQENVLLTRKISPPGSFSGYLQTAKSVNSKHRSVASTPPNYSYGLMIPGQKLCLK